MRTRIAQGLLALVLAVTAFAGGTPDEGMIWDKKGTTLFGDPFQVTLMIHHGHLIQVDDGSQRDYGPIQLNQYSEYEVPSALFKTYFPAIDSMTFKFSADLESVTETLIMNYNGRCVAGDCTNSVETSTYHKR